MGVRGWREHLQVTPVKGVSIKSTPLFVTLISPFPAHLNICFPKPSQKIFLIFMTCSQSTHTQKWLASISEISSSGHTQFHSIDSRCLALFSVLWFELCNLNFPSSRLCSGKIIFCRISERLPIFHCGVCTHLLRLYSLLLLFTLLFIASYLLFVGPCLLPHGHKRKKWLFFLNLSIVAFLQFTVIYTYWQYLVLCLLEAALDSVSAKCLLHWNETEIHLTNNPAWIPLTTLYKNTHRYTH